MPVKLMMTSCQSASDIIAIHGVDKELFTSFRDYGLSESVLEEFRADTSGAVVGEKIAARYGWKKGEYVTLTELDGIGFTVHGIYPAVGAADDFIILAGRRFLQEAEDEQGISNHVLVKLHPDADPAETSRQIDELPMTIETTTQPEHVFLATVLDQLGDLVSVSKAIIAVIICVIVVAMGNAISMATRERSAEIGILRTLGYQKGSILLMVMGEAVAQAVAGGVLGCLAAELVVSGGLLKTVSTCGVSIHFAAGPYAWGVGMATIILAGAVGSLAPAWSASRLKIVAAIRRED